MATAPRPLRRSVDRSLASVGFGAGGVDILRLRTCCYQGVGFADLLVDDGLHRLEILRSGVVLAVDVDRRRRRDLRGLAGVAVGVDLCFDLGARAVCVELRHVEAELSGELRKGVLLEA